MTRNTIVGGLACATWVAIAAIALQRHQVAKHAIKAPPRVASNGIGGSGMASVESPLKLPGGSYAEPDPVVPLAMRARQSNDRGRAWLLTYERDGRIAQFSVHFDPPREGSKADSFPLSVGEGRFDAISGSDPSLLVPELQKVLHAVHRPARVTHQESLPFTYAILGERQSKSSDGGFSGQPAGTWTAMKIFLGGNSDEDEGEVFFNFNSDAGQAEFSMKDPDYGDIVLRHLITIL